MLSQLREGDTIIVAKFNRLGRSTTHLISLVNDFAQKGIHFRALDFGIDTTTPTGRLMLTFFAALAEYERETILEKTRAGQLLAKAKGKHVGRPAKINEEKYAKVKKHWKTEYLLLIQQKSPVLAYLLLSAIVD